MWGRITRLMERLGDPHLHLPPVIHIAGTNGKGSASAYCRALLEAQGLTVHVHTSPHLVSWAERFRIGHAGGGQLLFQGGLQRPVHANTRGGDRGQASRSGTQLGVQGQEGRKSALLCGRQVALQPVQQPGFVVAVVDRVQSTWSNWPMYSFSAVRPR